MKKKREKGLKTLKMVGNKRLKMGIVLKQKKSSFIVGVTQKLSI
jgi:hypothetical protein